MSTVQHMASSLDAVIKEERDTRVEAIATVGNPVSSLQDAPATPWSGTEDDVVETVVLPRQEHQHITYPAWPTSQPGPQETFPPPGQHPHPLRTDQMVYECYDQERGMPCVPPLSSAVQKHRGKIYLPDAHFQDRGIETGAMERWLDDGGSSEQETTSKEENVVVDTHLVTRH